MLEKLKENNKEVPPELAMPMVRLKIENTGFSVIKSKRINDHFINRIANSQDFLQFYKKSGYSMTAGSKFSSK